MREDIQQGAATDVAGLSQVEPAGAVSPLRASIPSAWGEGQTIHRGWIIVHEPKRIPDLHIPYPQSEAGMDAALEALTKLRPAGTTFTVARLTWNGDLWIEAGADRLAENAVYDSLTAEDWAQINGRYEDPQDEEDLAPGGEAASAAETGTGSAEGKHPVAVGEAPASIVPTLHAEIARLSTALADSERMRKEAEGRAAVITSAFAKFVGVALTAQKSNTVEWMVGLAEDVNEAARAIGTSDRFTYDRRAGLVRLSKSSASTTPKETTHVEG